MHIKGGILVLPGKALGLNREDRFTMCMLERTMEKLIDEFRPCEGKKMIPAVFVLFGAAWWIPTRIEKMGQRSLFGGPTFSVNLVSNGAALSCARPECLLSRRDFRSSLWSLVTFTFGVRLAGLPDPLPPFTYTGNLNISEVSANVCEEKGANEDSMVLTEWEATMPDTSSMALDTDVDES